mgnify:CR=1 FL=1
MAQTTRKTTAAKNAPANKAKAEAPENKAEPKSEAPALTDEQKRELLETATAAARLAKDETGKIDIQAELIAINRKIEYIAKVGNIRLPA